MKYWLTALELISGIDDTIPISSFKIPLMASLIAPIEISTRDHSPTRTCAPPTHTSMKLEEIDYQCFHRIFTALM